MPRVSEAHLAARREQIIEAATRCFLRNGFHQTSMQDVIKEAGLSVGAFYRYFDSKAALIKAIAGEKIGIVQATADHLLAQDPAPPLLAVIDDLLRQIDVNLTDNGTVRIAVQVWGEAVHDPEFAALISEIYGRIRGNAVALARRAQETGQLPAGADPAAVGSAIFGLIQGYILQRVLIGQVDRETYVGGVGALLQAGTGAGREDRPPPVTTA
ncbi:TetR/AcrR family transcriptional regulator [Dactylosporangium siamense]|uniref:TetR family transcriptional regulator n=1 Tax=Dactylosporangium siamense TaxID=685454 RepID=A0A919PTH5_9ACTN|nr:TetR/AcrR family transcriptional regulator [Dactylosporangium siamense]GIG48155.1 TetR family transcriptional regulator [Dactylosporangium siamense]